MIEKNLKDFHVLGLQIDLKICAKSQSRLCTEEIRRKQFFCQIAMCSFDFLSFNEYFLPSSFNWGFN